MPGLFFILLKAPGFTEFIRRFGYIGIFIWFVSFDQVTLIPEEISLLIIGYLCAHGVFHAVPAGLLCLSGFLAVDIAYYFLSKTGSKLLKKKSGRREPTWASNYKERLKTNMPRTIAVLTFIPRMRMWAPILSGSMKLPFRKFIVFDGIALAVFTTVYLSLGFIFNKSLSALMSRLKNAQNYVFFGFVLLAVIVFVVIERRRRKKDK